MPATKKYTAQHLRLLRLLSTQYPNRCAVYSKLINLTSELSLPKGTEHFISDIHGEYDAFRHIINNASGVIKDKVKIVLDNCTLKEKDELCTLIYYPSTVMKKLKQENVDCLLINPNWTRHANVEHCYLIRGVTGKDKNILKEFNQLINFMKQNTSE